MSLITLDDVQLSSYEPLERVEKQKCAGCQGNRMYYCYDCRTPLPGVFTPSVQLPCGVDIIKHCKEKNGKSTSLHCKIVAPGQTRVFDAPDGEVFDYRQEPQGEEHGGSTVLIFPSPSVVSMEEFVRTRGPIKRIVVLDCTWFQVGVMQRLPQIQGLPCVSLRDYRTAFWRPQHNKNDSHLATIEAIYYALREYQELGLKKEYKGEFDDLLYYFFFTQRMVKARKEEGDRKRRAAAAAIEEGNEHEEKREKEEKQEKKE